MDHFEQLVFSGGGTRCFWFGGFLEATRTPLRLQPDRIAGVSGGALSAACFIADCGPALLEHMGEGFERVDDNLDLAGDEPGDGLTPHQCVYRQVVERTIDARAEALVADGPQFQVLLAFPPSKRFAKWSTILMMSAYLLDLRVRSTPDLKFTRWAGIRCELVDARQAARDGKLTDLICNAAVIPPVFNLQRWNGKQVVDGGLACKSPMPEPDRGRTLVLLTRQYRNLPDDPNRVYASVSQRTPADKLDFSDPDKIRRTWQMGIEDGERFLHRLTGARRGAPALS